MQTAIFIQMVLAKSQLPTPNSQSTWIERAGPKADEPAGSRDSHPDDTNLATWEWEIGSWELTSSQSENRLNSSAPFVPPKPNEFESAYSIFIGRLVFGT